MIIFSGACTGIGSGAQALGQASYTPKLGGIGIIMRYWYTCIKFWIKIIQQ